MQGGLPPCRARISRTRPRKRATCEIEKSYGERPPPACWWVKKTGRLQPQLRGTATPTSLLVGEEDCLARRQAMLLKYPEACLNGIDLVNLIHLPASWQGSPRLSCGLLAWQSSSPASKLAGVWRTEFWTPSAVLAIQHGTSACSRRFCTVITTPCSSEFSHADSLPSFRASRTKRSGASARTIA